MLFQVFNGIRVTRQAPKSTVASISSREDSCNQYFWDFGMINTDFWGCWVFFWQLLSLKIQGGITQILAPDAGQRMWSHVGFSSTRKGLGMIYFLPSSSSKVSSLHCFPSWEQPWEGSEERQGTEFCPTHATPSPGLQKTESPQRSPPRAPAAATKRKLPSFFSPFLNARPRCAIFLVCEEAA